jgi:DNA-binding NarL/FixJ family response regulator
MGRAIAIVRDLLFREKIRLAAGNAGWSLRFLRNEEALQKLTSEDAPAIVFTDLNLPEGIALTLLCRERFPECKAVGFFSHVDEETGEAARKAGIDDVLPRSKFVLYLSEYFRQ